jgi:HSP20 family protein
MTLIRWSPALTPARDMVRIQDEVNRLFDGFFGRAGLRADIEPVFSPAIDIEETPEEFVVRADLPGLSQKDVKVSLMGDTLTLRGERRQESAHKEGNLHRVERLFGSFERSFTLGTPVRNDKVNATYRDGVLEVHVPKAEEARLKEVEVQVG